MTASPAQVEWEFLWWLGYWPLCVVFHIDFFVDFFKRIGKLIFRTGSQTHAFQCAPHRPAETWLVVESEKKILARVLSDAAACAGQMGSVHQRNEHFVHNEHYSNEQLDTLLNAAQNLFSTSCFPQWAQCTVHLWLLKNRKFELNSLLFQWDWVLESSNLTIVWGTVHCSLQYSFINNLHWHTSKQSVLPRSLWQE